MRPPIRTLHAMSAWSMAVLWAVAGVTKLLDTLGLTTQNAPTHDHPELAQTWADTFPTPLITTLSVAEIAAAFLIVVGARARSAGLLLGSSLLSAFVVALFVSPPSADMSCGCFGAADHATPLDIASRIVLLSSIHILAFATCPTHAAHKGIKQELPEPA